MGAPVRSFLKRAAPTPASFKNYYYYQCLLTFFQHLLFKVFSISITTFFKCRIVFILFFIILK